MGLATVYGIVKQNSGYVYVTREKDKGTSFKLLFPSMNDFETDDFLSARRSTKIPIGKETILLVVDDEITLNLGKTLLEKLNYTVICAGFPQKALELARSYPGENRPSTDRCGNAANERQGTRKANINASTEYQMPFYVGLSGNCYFKPWRFGKRGRLY